MDNDHLRFFQQMWISKKAYDDDHDYHCAKLQASWKPQAGKCRCSSEEIVGTCGSSFHINGARVSMRPAVGRRTFRLGCWKVDAKMTKDCTGEITTTGALPLKGDGESSHLRVRVRRHKANRVCSVPSRHEGQCVRVRTHNISFELGMTMHQRCFSQSCVQRNILVRLRGSTNGARNFPRMRC